jgi:hypothetical protein
MLRKELKFWPSSMPIGNGFETKSHEVNKDIDIILME